MMEKSDVEQMVRSMDQLYFNKSAQHKLLCEDIRYGLLVWWSSDIYCRSTESPFVPHPTEMYMHFLILKVRRVMCLYRVNVLRSRDHFER